MAVGVCAVAASISVAVPISGASTAIVIDNPGFEAALLADGAFQEGDVTGAWTASGIQGEFNPVSYQISGEAYEGENVAFSNDVGGTIGQVLNEGLETAMRYTLSVQVGERKEGVPLGHRPYEVQLLAGGVILASTTGPVQVTDGWVQAEVSYDAVAGDPQIGTPLEIRLVNNGGQQLLWDDVQLTAEILANPPGSKADCKKGGWKSLTDDAGASFVNQGDCVSYVSTGGKTQAAG